MNGTNGVSVSKVAQIMDLYNFLPDMDLKKHRIKISDVNRPALQLSGFFEHFEQSRVQIIGNVEYTYLQRLDVEKKEKILQKFTTYDIPCIIFCRDLQPDEDFLQIASENDVPVLGTKRSTSEFMAELIFCLSEQLAQQIDLVIKLEDWKKENEYDRLGLEDEYAEFLGNKVSCHSLPIRPGRNLAVICETAAVNHRQKKMGYNAAQELYRRVQENITKGHDDDD